MRVRIRRDDVRSPENMWRGIVLDMDGTTLDSSQGLGKRTIDAVRRAKAAGLDVIIATGRPQCRNQIYISILRDLIWIFLQFYLFILFYFDFLVFGFSDLLFQLFLFKINKLTYFYSLNYLLIYLFT